MKISPKRNLRLSKSRSTLSEMSRTNNPTVKTLSSKDFTALVAAEIKRVERNPFLNPVRRKKNPTNLRNNKRKNPNQKRKKALNRKKTKNLKLPRNHPRKPLLKRHLKKLNKMTRKVRLAKRKTMKRTRHLS